MGRSKEKKKNRDGKNHEKTQKKKKGHRAKDVIDKKQKSVFRISERKQIP